MPSLAIRLLISGCIVSCLSGQASAENGLAVDQTPQAPIISTEKSFETLMSESMERMHAGMMSKPTGDPARDFLTMMIPHHQGAVDMAKIVLLYSQDPTVRNLAQSIVTEQTYEIALMRTMLTAGVPKSQTEEPKP